MNKKTETSISENKKKVQKKLILIYFNYKKSVIIDANTSECAMRAHLQQVDDQKSKKLIICYA